jgi:hypothetical protein
MAKIDEHKWKVLLSEVSVPALHSIEDNPRTHPKIFELALKEDKKRGTLRKVS